MITKPLLILAFNRPLHVKGLIDSLRPHQPQKILVGIDGPRKNNQKDSENIALVLAEIKKIDWTADIELRVRVKNLGLRFAVADAVSWAIEKHGEIIVVEDDIQVGPEFFTFMSEMLDKYRNDESIGHISGYNLVPANFLSNPNSKFRYSIYPESYAWATWSRSWHKFNPYLVNADSKKLLRKVFGRSFSLNKVVWWLNFLDAKRENINTWAFRWVASLWSNNLLCVTPNRNLIRYTGQQLGTHVRTKQNWHELEISPLPHETEVPNKPEADNLADTWISKNVFKASMAKVPRRIAESLGLSILRRIKN